MHFLTTSVLSLCFTVSIAAPVRSSRRSTMKSSQKALGDTVDRVLVDIPLSAAEILQGETFEIGALARSLKLPNSLDMNIEELDVIRIEVDSESLRAAKRDHACGDAFQRKKHDADEDSIREFDPENKFAVFRKEDTGLWSIRCLSFGIEGGPGEMPEAIVEATVEEVPEEIPVFPSEDSPESVPEIPEFVPDIPAEPLETKETTEETTEVTTEVTTRVTTKVTTEVTTKKSTEGVTEETSEQTFEETSEETSEGMSEEASTSVKKRSTSTEGNDDKNSRRGVAVNEFDIEIL